jgi:hypothetical protein
MQFFSNIPKVRPNIAVPLHRHRKHRRCFPFRGAENFTFKIYDFMTTSKKSAAKAAQANQVANANEVSKSVTTQVSAKADKPQPTAEELAAKAAKKAERAYNKVVNEIIAVTKHKVLDPVAWMKQAKIVAKQQEPAIAKAIEAKWATLCVEVKRAGAYYAESVVVTDKKSGQKTTAKQYHMVEFRPATKVAEIGRAITPTEYRFAFGEDVVEIKSVKDLTVNHEVIERDKISKEIDGETYYKVVERKVLKDFRPVEILDLTPSEFGKRFKLAMQVVFPNNTFC